MRRAIFRDAGPFKVTSRADGTLLVEPSYAAIGPRECRTTPGRMQGTYCRACDCYHIFGVMGRMALASEIQAVLARLAKPVVRKQYVTKRGRLRRRLRGRVVCPLTSVHFEAEMSCRPNVSARALPLGLYKSAARLLGIESADLAVAIAVAADGQAEAPFVPDPERGLDEPPVLVSLRALLEKATKVAR